MKLTEFSKEEIKQQLEENIIDIDFLIDYIVMIDHMYNLMIDRIEELEKHE